jgi:hypothetical protein
MALGPKAMGEAIVSNLKAKTGKDLASWRAELEHRSVTDPVAAKQLLKELGLGHFQAVVVVERHFSADQYADERRLVSDLFERFPQQLALYEGAVAHLTARKCTPQPCRGYLPVYLGSTILISFKPTARGLYAALNLPDRSLWPTRVAHKPSLGGSARLKDGVYLSTRADVKRLLDGLTA